LSKATDFKQNRQLPSYRTIALFGSAVVQAFIEVAPAIEEADNLPFANGTIAID
jgi:hypothetical protein